MKPIVHIFLRAVLCVFAFLFFLPTRFFSDLTVGLDPSWQIALQLAFEKPRVFGQDFIFTYGPLGFISTRFPSPSNFWLLLTHDLFIYFTLILIFISLARRLKSYVSLISLVLVCWLAGNTINSLDIVVVHFAMMLYLLFEHRDTKKSLYLILAAILSVVIFYVKLNLGLASVMCMIAYCISLAATDSIRTSIIAIVLYTVCLWSTSLFIPVDIMDYIIASLHIASGYNEGMFLTQPDKLKYLWYALSIVVAYSLTCLSSIKQIFKNLENLLPIAFVTGFIFIIFKQSFVRADEHVFTFIDFISVPIGLACLATSRKLSARLFFPLIVSLAVSIYIHQSRLSFDYVEYRFEAFQSYLSQMQSYDNSSLREKHASMANLPSEFLKEIGSKTVDIIPWDISQLYYYNLNYEPRPVMQSYSAYDEYLDGKNANKYLSDSAPEYLIYALQCTDDRYCFFDETKTKLAMYSNYEIVKRTEHLLLFKKRKQPFQQSKNPVSKIVGQMNQWIEVPESKNILISKINVSYSLMGKLLAIFYKPPKLMIEIELTSGENFTYWSVLPIIKAGIISNRFIESTSDSVKFFKGKFKKMKQIKKFRFVAENNSAFQSSFTATFEEIKVKQP